MLIDSFRNKICGFEDKEVKDTFKARRGVNHKSYTKRFNT
jgi:hypothetical protein